MDKIFFKSYFLLAPKDQDKDQDFAPEDAAAYVCFVGSSLPV